ncbi:MAG: hypothetical protein J5J00_04230 [Deltaproteobacteria bacterium]|nr:hypothetical protein [Deltaproteobacteria bacterium]
MTKTKKKQKPQSKGRRVVLHGRQENSESKSPVQELWKEELNRVTEARVGSFEEAIQILITAVLQKMNVPAAEVDEAGRFMLEMIESDPALVEEIKAAFKLR